MFWARMLAYVSGRVEEELLLRNEYLAAENRILKAQIKGRLLLSEEEKTCPPEKPQESLILGVPFSDLGGAAQCGSRIETAREPTTQSLYCRLQRWSDELSSFYLVFVWWSRRLGGHSGVAVM